MEGAYHTMHAKLHSRIEHTSKCISFAHWTLFDKIRTECGAILNIGENGQNKVKTHGHAVKKLLWSRWNYRTVIISQQLTHIVLRKNCTILALIIDHWFAHMLTKLKCIMFFTQTKWKETNELIFSFQFIRWISLLQSRAKRVRCRFVCAMCVRIVCIGGNNARRIYRHLYKLWYVGTMNWYMCCIVGGLPRPWH